MRFSRIGLLALVSCLFTGMATAASFSFTGQLTQDDQFQVFLFTAPSTNVLLRTWGYAGGVNGAGSTILAGGFDPVLSLFDATGGLSAGSLLVDSNNDGAGVATDLITGNAFDSLLHLTTLNIGHTYALVLTQNDNLANGPTYGDGFTRTGQGNFTAGAFGCIGRNPFCDATPAQRNGSWAVDISGVGSASLNGGTGAVPEPGSMLLLFTGAGALALLRRRRARVPDTPVTRSQAV